MITTLYLTTKTFRRWVLPLIGAALLVSACANSGSRHPEPSSEVNIPRNPQYANAETRAIVEKMIEAHGGWEAWGSTATVSFHKFNRPREGQLPHAPWMTLETIDKVNDRVFIELPLEGASMAMDGYKAWGHKLPDWKAGNTPPGLLSMMTYRFTNLPWHLAWHERECDAAGITNLPWLTQRKGARLGEVERKYLPNDETEYYAVRMDTDPEFGYAIGDFYTLYIHPETYRYTAVGFNLRLSEFNPPANNTPRLVHVFQSYDTVDGLTVPLRYHTYFVGPNPITPEREMNYNAVHDVWAWRFDRPFQEAWMNMPSDAIIDTNFPYARPEGGQSAGDV